MGQPFSSWSVHLQRGRASHPHPGYPRPLRFTAHLASLCHGQICHARRKRSMVCDSSSHLPPGNKGPARREAYRQNGLGTSCQRGSGSPAILTQFIQIEWQADGKPVLRKILSLPPATAPFIEWLTSALTTLLYHLVLLATPSETLPTYCLALSRG